jgi:hypothetical protein
MKINLFLILVLTFSISYAQIDSIREALKFCPLNTGNYWEYLTILQQADPSKLDTQFVSVKIIGDTILTNEKSY